MSKPISWHGGKHYLAPWIIEHFPSHLHYVEPFFGGGSVLLQKPFELIDGHSEVVNDIDGGLANFWRVLKDERKFMKMGLQLSLTPFSQDVWQESFNIIEGDDVGNAARFFTRYRQSRQGMGNGFATLSRNLLRRGMNQNVSAWLSAINGLEEAHARLKRVIILNDDANAVITSQDGAHTFVYADPPYLQETRTSFNIYDHEMTVDDHKKLLSTLEDMVGMFILSGYQSSLYDDWATRNGFTRIDKNTVNHASSSKVKRRTVECIWINYKLGT